MKDGTCEKHGKANTPPLLATYLGLFDRPKFPLKVDSFTVTIIVGKTTIFMMYSRYHDIVNCSSISDPSFVVSDREDKDTNSGDDTSQDPTMQFQLLANCCLDIEIIKAESGENLFSTIFMEMFGTPCYIDAKDRLLWY